jgi:ribosome biogenesis GTP-binding protein YsxC/EngB
VRRGNKSSLRTGKVDTLDARKHVSKKAAARVLAFENTRWHRRKAEVEHKEDSRSDLGEEKGKRQQSRINPKIFEYVDGLELGRRRQRRLPKEIRRTTKIDDLKYVQLGRVLLPKEDFDGSNTFSERVAKYFSLPFVCQYSAGTAESIPESLPHAPEIAVLGRSNVGKSSLLNALTGSHVVRTSSRPGKTRTLSWFSLGAKKDVKDVVKIRSFLVDVPGIGFAYASKEQREHWQGTLKTYLATRPREVLKRVLLLVDARHPIMPQEQELMRSLEKMKVPYQVVLTKADLVPPMQLAHRIQEHTEFLSREGSLSRAVKEIHAVSLKSPRALHALRCALYRILNATEPVSSLSSPSRSPSLLSSSLPVAPTVRTS